MMGWLGIARLGLVQAAIGAVAVLTTSTLNRVMVVELALPALLPGLLVALHYLVQVTRPRMGHGGDVGRRRTPWIIGGMALLAAGGTLASFATAWMATDRDAGIALAVLAFALIGLGVSAAGTSLLVLLAQRVAPERRAGAATVVWVMMIAGFAVTAALAGRWLDPYSPQRLVLVTGTVCALAFALAVLALAGLEGAASIAAAPSEQPRFVDALRETWRDAPARRFTLFVFVSMLAYSTQDLVLEPFAGAVLGYTPGQSTSLSGLQHGGVLAGMLLAALAGRRWRGRALGSLGAWTIAGCLVSAAALLGIAACAAEPRAARLFAPTVFLLGVANGVYSIGAIGSMMRLAGAAGTRRAGVRMGLWGAAQATAFGLGGLLGTAASDLAQALASTRGLGYAGLFAFEAALFLLAAQLAGKAVLRDGGAPWKPMPTMSR